MKQLLVRVLLCEIRLDCRKDRPRINNIISEHTVNPPGWFGIRDRRSIIIQTVIRPFVILWLISKQLLSICFDIEKHLMYFLNIAVYILIYTEFYIKHDLDCCSSFALSRKFVLFRYSCSVHIWNNALFRIKNCVALFPNNKSCFQWIITQSTILITFIIMKTCYNLKL